MPFWRRRQKNTEATEQPSEEKPQATPEAPPLETPTPEAPKPPELDTLLIRRAIEEYLAGCYGRLQSLEIITSMEPISSDKGAVVLTSFLKRGDPPAPGVGAFYISAETNTIKAFLIAC